FFQAEDGIRDFHVTGVQTCALPIYFESDEEGNRVRCRVRAECTGPTGVEMEALTAVSVGLLTIYDMCKAIDRGMVIEDVRLLEKSGGRSGHYVAPAEG